jgi:hypothetical protein
VPRLEAAFGPGSARWLHRLAHGMDEEEVGPGSAARVAGCWLLPAGFHAAAAAAAVLAEVLLAVVLQCLLQPCICRCSSSRKACPESPSWGCLLMDESKAGSAWLGVARGSQRLPVPCAGPC